MLMMSTNPNAKISVETKLILKTLSFKFYFENKASARKQKLQQITMIELVLK